MSDELGLKGVEEGFCRGVVPAIPFAAHALDAAMPFQVRLKIAAGDRMPLSLWTRRSGDGFLRAKAL